METIEIKGREYVMVNERIKHFRENYPDHRLLSEIVELKEGRCVIKAAVLDQKGNVIATGHAYEMEGSTFINKTSYIENCETSAWGRALGNLGIGIDVSIASGEEVGNAIKQQETKKPSPQKEHDKKRCREDQVQDLYGEGEKLGLTNKDVNRLVEWYRKGESLTFAEAKTLIADFPTESAKWTATQVKPEDRKDDIPKYQWHPV